MSGVSPAFQRAVQEARTILKETGDPQRSDVALDRACFGEMAQLAKDCKSAFLEGYVRLCIDAANLRTAVRVSRMEKGSDFLLQVLLPGGNVSEKTLSAARGEDLGSLFQTGPLAKAAELGAKAARPAGGPLTAFERECDNAVTRYVSDAKRGPRRGGDGDRLPVRQGGGAHRHPHHPGLPAGGPGRGRHPGAAAGDLCVTEVEEMYRIGVIGDRDSVLGFQALVWRCAPRRLRRRPGRPSTAWRRRISPSSTSPSSWPLSSSRRSPGIRTPHPGYHFDPGQGGLPGHWDGQYQDRRGAGGGSGYSLGGLRPPRYEGGSQGNRLRYPPHLRTARVVDQPWRSKQWCAAQARKVNCPAGAGEGTLGCVLLRTN